MAWNTDSMRGVAVAAVLAVSGILGAAEAQQRTPEPANPAPANQQAAPSGFRACNNSSVDIEVAKALNTTTDGGTHSFVSEGWYKLARGACMTLWPGELKYRYYLVYAQAPSAKREWTGGVAICVSREPFTIRYGYCEADKYQRKFHQVDTGDSKNWTHNFKD